MILIDPLIGIVFVGTTVNVAFPTFLVKFGVNAIEQPHLKKILLFITPGLNPPELIFKV
jgi:hypothetical protein